MQTSEATGYHGTVPLLAALGLLGFEALVLAGGLWWTFRRAQLPVGLLGSLCLASVVGVAQLALLAVVEVAARYSSHIGPPLSLWAMRLQPVSVLAAGFAVAVAAPLALKRFLKLDDRWTRALSRELLAGFIASTFAGLALAGAMVIAVLIIAALVHGH